MKKYIPSQIESKWQKQWEKDNLYLTNLSEAKNKYYVLVELPYTSGDLHMGHWFTFTMGDILARFKRRQGLNVLFPNGFDAFGLPAENAAIKQKIHPRDWTYRNMERMRAQFETMGASIDWTKTMIACDPKYYKWNQWIFLKMLEKGLAYKGKLLSNWCPKDKTVLANENVEDGKCWRCGTEVVQKEIEQWFFKITQFADRLLWQDTPQADWPKALRVGQNEWIGKSEGVLLKFKSEVGSSEVEVFTTALDTVFGVTFLVVSPENPLLASFVSKEQRQLVEEYCKQANKKSELERKENKEKTGVFTGGYVVNPFNNEKVPVWVADYVLSGYGTGSVMGVPGHDARDHEFAKKFGLEIKPVIKPKQGVVGAHVEADGFWDYPELKGEFAEKSVLFNSGKYTDLTAKEAKEQMSNFIESNGLGKRQRHYHLHDWSISRQRYWGTPIPIIYCDKCGAVPVPEKNLPVELPYKVDYAPKGKPPLATAEDWVNAECPKCGGPAKREVETMDTFVDSAWYFFRYLDPENDVEPFDKLRAASWMPLEIYIGGPEHTLGHALYSRFFTMVFKDLGLVKFDEYALKRIHHGTILGSDGARMSKSRGNVVNPDEEVKKYGADAIRLYLMFLGPFDIVTSWNPNNVNGAYHFLQRVWGLQEKATNSIQNDRRFEFNDEDLRMMHKTIKKVTEDLEQLKFNTAIAAMMEWLNYLSKKEQISKEEYKIMLQLLAPFVPHITEELWSFDFAQDKQNWSIHQQSWPQFDNNYLEQQEIAVAVQIETKVRDILMIQKDIISNREEVEKMALDSKKVQKFLAGKSVKKVVYIPGKIISLVTGS